MGNITETTHFENLQADLEADVMDENTRWIDELTEASYESEVDLDRDMPTEVEQLEADVELYYEGLGHS